MGYLEFPTQEEWKAIYDDSPFPLITTSLNEFRVSSPEGSILKLLTFVEANSFRNELVYRIRDLAKSYIFLMFFFNKGIPDDEWFISPSSDGKKSIEYFPHFEDDDFYTKEWFDFYADTFYFNLFSSVDVIGHLLNFEHDLEINIKPSFHKATEKLKQKNTNLYSQLNKITSSHSFQTAKKIRDNITHNRLPGSVGMSVTRKKTEGLLLDAALGIRKDFKTSKEIVTNVHEILEQLRTLIDILGNTSDDS